MNSIAFFLTFISGFSTLLGLIPTYIKIKKEHMLICFSLAFASSVMLIISIFDLIPEAFKYSNYNIILVYLFVLFGIIISYVLDFFISKNNNSLYNVGIISMIGIIIHNIPEGIITFISSSIDIKLGLSMCIAISLHNIPEGISIGVPIYYSTGSRFKAFIYTFCASISEFIGGVFTYFFLRNFITDMVLGILFSFVSGLMIYISLFELFRESFKYCGKYICFLFFIIGIIFITINVLLL